MRQNIVIIGSTGSIGTQTLEVIRNHPREFKVLALACYQNIGVLAKQMTLYRPKVVAIYDKNAAKLFTEKLTNLSPKLRPTILAGPRGWEQIATLPSAKKIVFSSSGLTALPSLLSAIKSRKGIALANKEMIVAAGEMIMKTAKKYGVTIVPIDSEHSAIFQCLQGEDSRNIEKIILTCSGGPFFGKKKADIQKATLQQVLNHPTWKMGSKITVDSATLMNKAFEMIEAKHLFGLRDDQIDMIIHPESIIHSFVQFKDGSIKAQAAVPDMRIPIAYALAWPRRLTTSLPRLNFSKMRKLTFFPPDLDTFPAPKLAREVSKKGGNLPAALTEANSRNVGRFLKGKISFPEIYEHTNGSIERAKFIKKPSLRDIQNITNKGL